MKFNDTNLNNYPYLVNVGKDGDLIRLEIYDWLDKNVGEYYQEWSWSGFDFYFKEQKDATLFALKWA